MEVPPLTSDSIREIRDVVDVLATSRAVSHVSYIEQTLSAISKGTNRRVSNFQVIQCRIIALEVGRLGC